MKGRSQREILHDSAFARLQARLETMPVIEQAKGIVMAQNRCGPDEAFDLLRRASQRANVKISVLAAHLVEQIASPNPPVALTQPGLPTAGTPIEQLLNARGAGRPVAGGRHRVAFMAYGCTAVRLGSDRFRRSGPVWPVQVGRPQQDSNLRSRLRRPPAGGAGTDT